ncbi:MAG: redoxin domain-containing protein [Saprospiraceae bacterium]|nr:redoxin domain-containing protein [Saprospiraceae bacterium]
MNLKTIKYHRFLIIILLSCSVFTGMKAQESSVKVYSEFTELEKDYFDVRDGKIHVINFWATWCKPCVAEMPYIDALTEKYGEDIKVTLVSLDFPRKIKSKLLPFMEKNQLKSEVVLLDDGNVNVWIDKVDPSWSGAIPATIVFKDGTKYFYEQEFHSAEELDNIISKINQ